MRAFFKNKTQEHADEVNVGKICCRTPKKKSKKLQGVAISVSVWLPIGFKSYQSRK